MIFAYGPHASGALKAGEVVSAALFAGVDGPLTHLIVQFGRASRATGLEEAKLCDAQFGSAPDKFFEGFVTLNPCRREHERQTGFGMGALPLQVEDDFLSRGVANKGLPGSALSVEQFNGLPLLEPDNMQGVMRFLTLQCHFIGIHEVIRCCVKAKSMGHCKTG